VSKSREGVRFVNAAATATSATPAIPAKTQRGHIGLVVAVSIAAGVAVGLVLDLSVFAGGSEPQIIGSALVGSWARPARVRDAPEFVGGVTRN
jgi:hypothetical protein